MLSGASAVYVTSRVSQTDVAAAADLDTDTIGILPIPVDTSHFTPEADEIWLERIRRPVIGFVGRADDPRKNITMLTGAFELVRRELPQARLRLIGRPPAIDVSEGIEAVGPVTDVAPLLRECTVLVLPSLQEGFGIVVAEAFACGVPAVVTPCGGPEEIVQTSGGGEVLSSWSKDELAEVLLRLLGEPLTLSTRRRKAREYALTQLSPERFAVSLTDALAELDG